MGDARDDVASDERADLMPTRRVILAALSAAGVGSMVFQRALAAQAEATSGVTAEMIQQAEWIAGLNLSDEDRKATAAAVQGAVARFSELRKASVDYGDPPALLFNPTPGTLSDGEIRRGAVPIDFDKPLTKPDSADELAYLPVSELSRLLRTKQVSSMELTNLYLERLHRHNEKLLCVVTFLDDLARKQAAQADEEIRAGKYRGPLHGIPWGAKDLIAYPGYKTTWGAVPFQEQVLDHKATVAQRLDDAGAVLVAKLSLGALAWGDQWFGGMTRNPWKLEQGSSGSSAGSAAATAAGLVGFTLGSETLGSIVSPCRRCGTTGLRPTFGRVSRYGCMPLAWSMDKIGPICRSVEDCAIVFDAIHGADGKDPTAVSRPFHWPAPRDWKTMRVGYIRDEKQPDEERQELKVLRELGVQLIPIQLPDSFPLQALSIILTAEASTVFDELTRTNRLEGTGLWPNSLRQGQFIPVIEYLRANRIRWRMMQEMEQVMKGVDAYVGGDDLMITNLTGHPTVVLPQGMETRDGVERPKMLTMTGQLYGEADLLALADAFQKTAGDAHRRRPAI
ncbi:MAG: Glutamyl-tRNA(Gln) amidotransferase subunit [Planctomycetota bacterium]